MAAAKHTPAPWRLEFSSGSHARTAYVRADSWGVVAAVGLDPSLPHWDGPQNANAHLIAAAPKLLAALDALTKRIHGTGFAIAVREELANAGAAIAAATGAAQ